MIDDLRSLLSSPDASVRGKAGSDFAQNIWSGRVADTVVLDLLNDESDYVRSAIAWAVADAHRPQVGVDWLLEHGIFDTCAMVRYWATRFLIETNQFIPLKQRNRINELRHDESIDVRKNAQLLVDKWSDK